MSGLLGRRFWWYVTHRDMESSSLKSIAFTASVWPSADRIGPAGVGLGARGGVGVGVGLGVGVAVGVGVGGGVGEGVGLGVGVGAGGGVGVCTGVGVGVCTGVGATGKLETT